MYSLFLAIVGASLILSAILGTMIVWSWRFLQRVDQLERNARECKTCGAICYHEDRHCWDCGATLWTDPLDVLRVVDGAHAAADIDPPSAIDTTDRVARLRLN